MKYNFDEIIDRHRSDCVKFDALKQFFGKDDLLPLWVADMDFATPDFIIDAIRERLNHPVTGYSIEPADYVPAIIDWLKNLHGVDVHKDWITYIPGIVKGIGMAIQCFTNPGDKVVIMPPVYHPFRIVPEANERIVIDCPLQNQEGKYAVNFTKFEEILSNEDVKMVIFANPHNPIGIVWDKATLSRLADICVKYNVILISDEIHSEIVFGDKHHIPFYSVSENAAKCSITFAAPTKTFNMAGIVSSYAIVPDRKLRHKFYSYLTANELNSPNMFAPIATIAAYCKGAEWRQQMMEYLEGNFDFIEKYLKENVPAIKSIRPEASFVVWLDCRELGLEQEKLVEFFIDKCGLALNNGAMFGKEGEGYMRLNAGCPRSTLAEALSRISKGVESLDLVQ